MRHNTLGRVPAKTQDGASLRRSRATRVKKVPPVEGTNPKVNA